MCGSLLELSREFFDDARDRSHILHLRNLALEVFQVELVAGLDLLGELFNGFLVDRLLNIFDERDDVAHAEDTTSHLLGIKELEAVELFSQADELDGFARDHAHRKGSTTAAVTVKLGQHNTCERQTFVKGTGRVNSVLTEHGVDHKKRFGRVEEIGQIAYFLHHGFVNGQTAGRIDNKHVVEVTLGVIEGQTGDVKRFLIRCGLEKVCAGLSRNGF